MFTYCLVVTPPEKIPFLGVNQIYPGCFPSLLISISEGGIRLRFKHATRDEGVRGDRLHMGQRTLFPRQYLVRLGGVTVLLIECESKVFEQTYIK